MPSSRRSLKRLVQPRIYASGDGDVCCTDGVSRASPAYRRSADARDTARRAAVFNAAGRISVFFFEHLGNAGRCIFPVHDDLVSAGAMFETPSTHAAIKKAQIPRFPGVSNRRLWISLPKRHDMGAAIAKVYHLRATGTRRITMAEERMLITGGQRLEGTVHVSGAKTPRSR